MLGYMKANPIATQLDRCLVESVRTLHASDDERAYVAPSPMCAFRKRRTLFVLPHFRPSHQRRVRPLL
jgi:hypothetical protein